MNKLFHKDFTLMILGQVISIFGNSILRFTISLYVLDLTGSAGIFAGILAISLLPTILLSPIGGMVSDRISRKHIMVVLDTITACLIFGFTLFLSSSYIVTLIGVFMILLSLIQSFYQPSVQASIPSITDKQHLVAANSIVVQINALANLAGPILGGLLYGFFPIELILRISSLCFACSAILEIFLHIPFIRQPRTSSMTKTILSDFKEAGSFIIYKNPAIFKMLLLLAGLNLFLTAMLQIGLPYIIKIQLGLSSQLYGFAESSMAIGMIIGSLYAAKNTSWLTINNSHRYLLFGSLAMLPIGLSVFSLSYALVSYGIIVIAILAGMSFIAIFNVIAQAFLQEQTPAHLLGKVSSYVMTLTMCAVPLGQAFYGICFDLFSSYSAWIVIMACCASMLLARYAKRVISTLSVDKEVCHLEDDQVSYDISTLYSE